jgi:XTP/dITP diphosphohydrolase
MDSLLIGSENRGKLREIRSILTDLPVVLVLPVDLKINLDVAENGLTYAENAVLKARAYQEVSGLVTLADDSGLEVDALDGRPGLHSHRFSPLPHASDADRRAHLLQLLAVIPQPWTARFRCAVAVAVPDGRLFVVHGECPGEIIPVERGHHGFGYDPVFYLPEYGATMAELDSEVKNRISHRARAVQAALPLLRIVFHLD